ncbi:nitroreductase family protein, partial [Candidatus Parvarchaeota archaeon]|nr:nitroreductase family protein [Candidatus Parvarchaeota archaeon]
ASFFSYSERPVPDETIIKILDAGRLAPAAAGISEYEFLVVTEQEKKDAISSVCLTPRINSAPFIIMVFCDPAKLVATFGQEDGMTLCVENAALAIENILLYAASLGLGTAWIATVKQDELRKVVGIPEKYIIRGVIPVGYPSDDSPRQTPQRKPDLKEITHIDSFDTKA